MTVTELSIKRPSLVIVVFTILAVLGYFSYNQLKYELIPEVTPPFVTIMTVYPGASPHEVETSISKPIEDAASNVDKIKRVYASSSEGVSFVWVEFLYNSDADIALQNVQRKINEIISTLPEQAKTPIVSKFSLTELPIIRMGATGSMPARDFYEFMKNNVKPRLTKIPGVGQITFIGGNEREIKINLDLDRLRAYNIPVVQVLQAVKTSNLDFPVGKIDDKDGQYIARISGKWQSIDEIRNLIVHTEKNGGYVKLKDIAEVEDGEKDAESYSRIDGVPALGVLVMKQTDANAVEVSKLIREELGQIEKDYANQKVKFDIAQDGSQFTLEAANAVNEDLLIAILLVAVVMLMFLHSIRNSIIVMIAIPSSLVSTFIAMWMFDFSLNLMTLLALSLVIGILVDDSIVVLENIYRHLEMGKDQRTAALEGRNEIGFAALSITLVDVVVFLPLALISGLIGNIVRQFAVVVVVSTLLSLFVSFTITPMLASRFTKLEHLTKGSLMGRFGSWFENFFDKITGHYLRILKLGLSNGWKVIALSFAALAISFLLIPFGFIGSEFMTPSDRGELSVILEMPERNTLEETNRTTMQIERMLSKMPEINKMFVNAGSSTEGFIGQTSNNISEINISLVPKSQRKITDKEASRIIKDMISKYPGVEARVSPIGIFGSADMSPIAIVVSGPVYDDVKKAADIVKEITEKTPGTVDERLSVGKGKPELKINIDREKMASLGIGLDQVASVLRVALTGDDESKFRQGNEEYDIRIVLDEFDRGHTGDLNKVVFVNNNEKEVQLSQFAEIENAIGPSELSRKNRNTSITVMSQVSGRTSGDIGADIQQAIAKANLPKGITISYEGDLEHQSDSFNSLGLALLVAILFVYLIMVALYDSFIYPFIVLFSIPVAMVGALFALALTVKSLNIFSILGIIMLMGLVGKNAILLVDRTNQMRAQGMSIYDALLDAGQTRLRPIMMTTFAMVFGMFPIAVSAGASSELKSSLATAIIGGLISSLLLTLVLVPVVYIKIENLKEKILAFVKKDRRETSTEYSGGLSFSVKKYFKWFSVILVGTAILSNSINAQTRRVSINDAVAIGLENNKQLKAAYFDKEINDYKIKEAWGNAFPEIKFGGQYVRNIEQAKMLFPFTVDPDNGYLMITDQLQPISLGLANNYQGVITAQMPLYQGAIYAGIRGARILNKISEESIIQTKANVISGIKKAYYNMLIAKEQYELLDQSIKRGEQALHDVRLLYKQGLASDLDTLRAYVTVENIKPSLIKAESGIAVSESVLKNAMGIALSEKIELADSLSYYPQDDYDFESLYEEAEMRRPELKLLDLQLQSDDEYINYEFSQHMPSLAAFGQYKIETESDKFKVSDLDWRTSSYVGLSLSVPIFSGLRTYSRVEQAKIEKKKTAVQIEDAREQISTEVKVNIYNYIETKKRIESQSKTVEAAERSYNMTRSRWLKGVSRQSELFDAELSLTQAKTNFLQAVYDYLTARVELEKAIGRTGRI
jgi:hydrophobe/amphiphile efflux-1 (HAE1) family protein